MEMSCDKREETRELMIYVTEEQLVKVWDMKEKDAENTAKEHHNWGMTTCGGAFDVPVRKFTAIAYTSDPFVAFQDGQPGQLYYKGNSLGGVLGYTQERDTDVGLYVTCDSEAFRQFCRDQKCFHLYFSNSIEFGSCSTAHYGTCGERVFE